MLKNVKRNLIYGCCSLAILAAAGNAKAEDQDYVSSQNNTQVAKIAPNDQQYKIPTQYNGKYFPDDDSAIGYHGTTNSASNQNQKVLDGNGYYYYYY